MEIVKQRIPQGLELIVKGRLDAYWAEHLSLSLAEVIREGIHHITLNLWEVVYLSSAGIRVLIQVHKQLKGIQGALSVTKPSPQVTSVLSMVGLDKLLLSSYTAQEPPTSSQPTTRRFEHDQIAFEIFTQNPNAVLTCQALGHPDRFADWQFQDADSATVSFPDSTFAIGLGAFGENFVDCRERFGEFLAVGGAAAYLPTDGTNVPDYTVSSGTLVPTLQVLYGLACQGEMAHLVRFEPTQKHHTITLTDLTQTCLRIAEADTVGIIMIAESAGLLGAALKRSPALGGSASDIFQIPAIRDWLSFTTERTNTKGVTIMVGIATQTDGGTIAPLLRPLGKSPSPLGHFHAAMFSYHPLQNGEIDLRTTVSSFFNSETLQGIIHLLNDDRDIVGGGQSEFIRGACWISPIHQTVIAEA